MLAHNGFIKGTEKSNFNFVEIKIDEALKNNDLLQLEVLQDVYPLHYEIIMKMKNSLAN
jgi:hypothetical protein